ISYYSWGSAIGLGLDLTLRTRFSGVTLDDYMRALWINYGKPERPYTLADLEHTLAALTQDADFADSFFRWHVYGSEMMDYEAVLAQGGFLLRKENPGTPWLGARIDDEEEQVILASGSMIDSPLYRAGLDNGDVILRLGNHAVTSTTQVDDILASHQPGDTLSIHFEQRGRQRQATLVLAEDPQLEVVTYETAGLPITEAIRAFREQWLGSRVQR
ncbi:MAG: PDZ domain-containing protein, partial [Gemmatimonadales bacterium]